MKLKIRFKGYKHCLEANPLDNEINHLDKDLM